MDFLELIRKHFRDLSSNMIDLFYNEDDIIFLFTIKNIYRYTNDGSLRDSEDELFNIYSFIIDNSGDANGYMMIKISDDITLTSIEYGGYEEVNNISIHGGITFDSQIDNWLILGFDTNHSGDNPRRWTLENVKQETMLFLESHLVQSVREQIILRKKLEMFC